MKVLDRVQTGQLNLAISLNTRQILLITLLVVAVFTRFWRLGTPGEFYFDEVYFPKAAQEIARGDKAAWEFYGHENTHPPLSKLIMAGGIKVADLLGDDGSPNPFAYRFPGALAGVGAVVFIYLLGKRLFKSEFVGLTAGFLLTFEGLAFVQSRIATPDTYVLFFVLGAVYFLVSDRFLLSGIFLGAAAASKWTATLTLVPIGLYFMYRFFQAEKAERRRFLKEAAVALPLFFILVPGYIYLLSYVPMLLNGYGFEHVWDLNRQAYEFHSSLKQHHAYESPWDTWPIMMRPIYFYLSSSGDAKIYTMGNPIIFWFGLPALAFALWQGLKGVRAKIDVKTYAISLWGRIGPAEAALLFVVLTYLGLWLPWSYQPRIMFLYHYLPAVPFMILALAYAVHRLWEQEYYRILAGLFLAVVVATFLYFYPHMAAVPVPHWLDESYYWFSSWR